MKLLLTSAGIQNQSIADSLRSLTGKEPVEVKVGFISTAVNMEEGNKDWYIDQFVNLRRFGYEWIDIIDPSAPDVDWQARLTDVDIVFVSGGNTFYLLDQYRRTGFDKWLSKNLENKVYVGVSAGTIVMAPTIEVGNIPPADRNFPELVDLIGMNCVDFEVEPHCNESRFAVVENYAKENGKKVYAIDDQTSIRVVDEEIQVISEGNWELYDSAKLGDL